MQPAKVNAAIRSRSSFAVLWNQAFPSAGRLAQPPRRVVPGPVCSVSFGGPDGLREQIHVQATGQGDTDAETQIAVGAGGANRA